MPDIQKILLVDDDPIFLKLAELAIKKNFDSVEIFKASHGEEAISFVSSNDIDVIYLDLNMPIMNGWEFLETVSPSDVEGTKIFVLTSSIDPSDKKNADRNPLVTGLLEKPLDKDKIASSMEM